MAKHPPLSDHLHGPSLRPKGSGTVNTPEGLTEGDDLPESGEGASRESLGDYLSNLTKVNHYTVTGGSKPAPTHRDIGGTPPVNTAYKDGGMPNGTGSEKTFLDETIAAGDTEGHHFTEVGKSDYKNPQVAQGHLSMAAVDSDVGTSPYNNGVGDSRGTGHTLLSGVKAHGNPAKGHGYVGTPTGRVIPPGPAPLQKRTSKILENNRFHPVKGSPYVVDGNFSSSTMGSMGSVQKVLGLYDPAAEALSVEKLVEIGRGLMLEATGHDFTDAVGASMLPSLSQIGIPFIDVNIAELNPAVIAGVGNWRRPLDILGAGGASATAAAGTPVSNIIDSSTSYGHLNSYKAPFHGPLPMPMIMVALAGFVALLVQAIAVQVVMVLIDNPLFRTKAPSAFPSRPASLPKGRRHIQNGNLMQMILDWMGIPALEGDTAMLFAIMRGVGTFYGVSDLYAVPGPSDFGDMMMTLTVQGGFTAGILRSCTRDLEGLVETAKQIGSSPIEIAGGVIAILQELGNNRSMRFMMTCAILGDRMFQIDAYDIQPTNKDIDRMQNVASTRVAKSRHEGPAGAPEPNQLVWSHRSLPRMMLLPTSFAVASTQYGLPLRGGQRGFMEMDNEFVTDMEYAVKGRIPKDKVKLLEDRLELEYVPFYFQDLRTNEILSFHAFIQDISEDFSPEYQSTGGYGRIDPIQVYKNTSRSINLTFIAAATSPKDFDSMWVAINKLVTMVYPQWTGGTSMKAADDSKFIMPFSQIPGATPLVRMRLGDVIKSNYSRFNLARIFGVDQPNNADGAFFIDGVAEAKIESYDHAGADPGGTVAVGSLPLGYAKHLYFDALYTPPRDHSESEFGWSADATAILMPNNEGQGFLKCGVDDVGNWNVGESARVKISHPTVVRMESGTSLLGEPHLGYPGVLPIGVSGPGVMYKVKFEDPEYQKIYDDTFWVDHSFLREDPKQTGIDFGVDEEDVKYDPGDDTANKWFKPETNEIVRTFESTGGRGLAGVITSLSLSYNDAPWDTRELGARAPMWMSISLGFAPIHDIPPGIDANGFNRAPVYPVGRAVNASRGPDIHDWNSVDTDDPLHKAFRADRGVLDEYEPKGDADGIPSSSKIWATLAGAGDGAEQP